MTNLVLVAVGALVALAVVTESAIWLFGFWRKHRGKPADDPKPRPHIEKDQRGWTPWDSEKGGPLGDANLRQRARAPWLHRHRAGRWTIGPLE